MIYFLLVLNFLWMLFIPLWLAGWFGRRYKVNWGLFGMGATTFVLSQVGHIPFNWLVLRRWQLLQLDLTSWENLLLMAGFLGLSAGLFEETARYLTFRFWVRSSGTWPDALMVGAGHGGIEAMLLGLLGLVNLVLLSRMQQGELSQLVTPDQWPAVQAQIDAMFHIPWYQSWMGALERLMAITFHLSASCLVLLSVFRGQIRWLFASMLWHSLLNAVAVVAVTKWGVMAAEGALALLTLLSLFIILRTRALLTPSPVAPREVDPQPLPVLNPPPPSKDALDRSKYT